MPLGLSTPVNPATSLLSNIAVNGFGGSQRSSQLFHPDTRTALMPTRIQKYRTRAFYAQMGVCHYCKCRMWLTNELEFRRDFKLSKAQSQDFRCTAEHVLARCDGGTDAASNIVAACARCNALRHARKRAMPSARFKDYVAKRIKRGGWHVLNALKAGLHGTSLSHAAGPCA